MGYRIIRKTICEICEKEFKNTGSYRKYCYECSPLTIKGNKESQVKNKVALKKAMKKKAVEIKGGKCKICGYNRCINALHFHHNESREKDFQLSNGNTMSWRNYKKELEKCDLLCANCHAEAHFE